MSLSDGPAGGTRGRACWPRDAPRSLGYIVTDTASAVPVSHEADLSYPPTRRRGLEGLADGSGQRGLEARPAAVRHRCRAGWCRRLAPP